MPPNTGKTCSCEPCNWPVGKHICSILNQQHIPQELEQHETLRLEHLRLEQQEALRLEIEQNDATIHRNELELVELQKRLKFLQRVQQELKQAKQLLYQAQNGANQQLQLIMQQKKLYKELCRLSQVHECSQLQKEKLEKIRSEVNRLQHGQTLSEVRGFELFRELIQQTKQINVGTADQVTLDYYREAQQRLNEEQIEQNKFLEELCHLHLKMDELREELCQINDVTINLAVND